MVIASVLFVSCNKVSLPVVESLVEFSVQGSGFDTDVTTKASVVNTESLASSGFKATATTGSAGSESQVWNNVSFSKSGGVYVGNKYWPVSDPSYHFYASNAAITFNASGCTVAASNSTDVVCAYMPSPAYKATNTLTFEHIFARIGNVTFSAIDGYTITGISVTITPKTGGTYNMRTGAGQTDGTGWSSLTTGSATSITNSTPGTKSNDLYLVPGTYTLTASWTATKGDYSETFSNKPCDIEIMGGKINRITCSLTGDAKDVSFGVTVTPWDVQNKVAEFIEPAPATFGGLMIAPAPLYYNGTTFEIKDDDWNHDSYNSVYGKNAGSYYFNFIELGQYFDADGASFSTSSRSIDNTNKISYNGYNDWRVPTRPEWLTITTGASPGTSRTGSTVNGTSGVKYAFLQLTGVTHAGNSTPCGLLLFPDDRVISGKTLKYTNNNGFTSSVTGSELQNYLDQGCVFLPFSGINTDAWYYPGTYGYYWSATYSITSDAYHLYMLYSSGSGGFNGGNPLNTASKTVFYMSVRLVRTAQ